MKITKAAAGFAIAAAAAFLAPIAASPVASAEPSVTTPSPGSAGLPLPQFGYGQ